MFTKLKKKVKEESVDSLAPSITLSNEIKTKKSVSSDGNHSSGDDLIASPKANDLGEGRRQTISSSSAPAKSDAHVGSDLNNKFNSNVNEILSASKKKYQELEVEIEKCQYEDVSSTNNVESDMKAKLKQLNESLLKQIEDLSNEFNEKLNENEKLRSELGKLNTQIEDNEYELQQLRLDIDDFKSIISNYEAEIKTLNQDKNELIIKNAELAEKYELLKLVNTKQNQSDFALPPSTPKTDDAKPNDLDDKDDAKILRDELNEKNKVIKNLQQRLNDMKKTLQKELKYQTLPNEQNINSDLDSSSVDLSSSVRKESKSPLKSARLQRLFTSKQSPINQNQEQVTQNNSQQAMSIMQSSSPPTIHPNNVKTSQKAIPIIEVNQNSMNKSSHLNALTSVNNTNIIATNSPQLDYLHDDVNFKYLKHVVFKFLTNKEYEAPHLVKALSVLLNFTSDEERILKETLQQRRSAWSLRRIGRTGQT